MLANTVLGLIQHIPCKNSLFRSVNIVFLVICFHLLPFKCYMSYRLEPQTVEFAACVFRPQSHKVWIDRQSVKLFEFNFSLSSKG